MTEDLPREARLALLLLEDALKDDLLAVFLCGSAVLGGLRSFSDVDLIAVTRGRPDSSAREALGRGLLGLSSQPRDAGVLRPLEVTVFSVSDLDPPVAAFQYGEWERAKLEDGGVLEPFQSDDLLILLAQARKRSVAIKGPPAATVIPEVSPVALRDALRGDLPRLLDGLHGDERNVLLTLARIWRTLEVGDFAPKDEAADWALERLEPSVSAALRLAREEYLGETSVDWDRRGREVQAAAGALAARTRAAF